ncbi:hypothetical protein BDF20DRAFT_909855 [Mycotypha africana]|uniref:uncharacterized protein n=1 Tax=Mycotypha africana TaxID=64632 RepID=UPI002301EB6D|nr:uncharacterized protein BDF20DRAFT_909855 [Mycotypha africana]KAI8992187.1 hypothetical protein BDF20DRAFT_909855 [Mycotypha africana]
MSATAPTVNAEQIRRFYNNVKSNNNKPAIHAKYDYYQSNSFEEQLNDFISYTEVQNNLLDFQDEYNSTYPKWHDCTLQEKKEIISNCFEHLDFIHDEERVNAAKCLSYISLGNYEEFIEKRKLRNNMKSIEERDNDMNSHLELMKENNQLLYTMDILTVLQQSLKRNCHELELSSTLSQSEAVSSFCKEIDMNLTILYMVIQFNHEKKERIKEANLLETLFNFIIRLKEYFTSAFPLRKLMLTIQRLLSISFGDLDTNEYKAIKTSIRRAHHLPPLKTMTNTTAMKDAKSNKETMIKCTPEELYNIFYRQSLERYPTFTPTPPPSVISDPLLITSSNTARLIKAMGLSEASKNIDLPYQTLFPSKNGGGGGTQQQQQQMKLNSNNGHTLDIRDSSFLALMEEPYSLKEANTVWMDHLYISVGTLQLLHEKNKAVHRWQRHLQNTTSAELKRKQRQEQHKTGVGDVDDIDKNHTDPDEDGSSFNEDNEEDDTFDRKLLSDQERKALKDINQFYAFIVPNLQKIVVVFLKLLLSTISITSNGKAPTGEDDHNGDSNKVSNAITAMKKNNADYTKSLKNAAAVEAMDQIRNKEILSKAVSTIILTLLKWFKLSHILKFEYLSQMLIDCGCMLLILKLIGLQEMPLLAVRRSDHEEYSFFGFIHGINAGEDNVTAGKGDSGSTDGMYTNKRNICWSIHLLRILQMLTKNKNQRISLLVQYKSSAVLKKLLKVGHPTLDHYVLKNLKCQVPLMSRKWRTGNMKTISAIYAHCLTSLNDDWLSRPDNDHNKEEYRLEEISLRMLIKLYIGERYIDSLLPTLDEFTELENCSFFNSTHHNRRNANESEQQQQEKEASNTNMQMNRHSLLPEYVFNHMFPFDNDPFVASTMGHGADLEVEGDFKLNYRQWLEKEVYSLELGDNDKEVDYEDDDTNEQNDGEWDGESDNKEQRTNGWDTPIPNSVLPPPLSPEQLTKEINRIYQEELEREFIEKEKRREMEIEKKETEIDGWGNAIAVDTAATANGWNKSTTEFSIEDSWRDDMSSTTGTTATNGTVLTDEPKQWLSSFDDDEDADDPEVEFDPLEGIDWQNLSEEELKKRLTIVEQKTVHRYMNVKIDDEEYLKVINPLDTQLTEDEDGWFIE